MKTERWKEKKQRKEACTYLQMRMNEKGIYIGQSKKCRIKEIEKRESSL